MTEGPRQTRSASEPAFDAAIDRAVRDMMSVDAPSGFRSRVLGRLENPTPRPVPWVRLAAGASLAAAVLAAFVLVRSRPDNIERQAPPQGPVAAARPPSAPTPSTGGIRFDRAQSEDRRRVVAATTPPDDVPPAFEIAPLDAIQPIAIAPIEPASIRPPALSLEPLAPIVEVQLEPLSPPRGQD